MTTEAPVSDPSEFAGKYLTVVLADESYGIAVLKVREIVRLCAITTMPRMPDFDRGVIHLRDRVIPVVDLRLKFGLDAQTDGRACIVVVGIANSGRGETSLGLIVDAVEEVVHLDAKDILPPPGFCAATLHDYLLGMAKVRDRVKILLNIDRALSAESLCRLESTA